MFHDQSVNLLLESLGFLRVRWFPPTRNVDSYKLIVSQHHKLWLQQNKYSINNTNYTLPVRLCWEYDL